ncbi:hypothetical protein D3C72_1784220 [compost metagenome]
MSISQKNGNATSIRPTAPAMYTVRRPSRSDSRPYASAVTVTIIIEMVSPSSMTLFGMPRYAPYASEKAKKMYDAPPSARRSPSTIRICFGCLSRTSTTGMRTPWPLRWAATNSALSGIRLRM